MEDEGRANTAAAVFLDLRKLILGRRLWPVKGGGGKAQGGRGKQKNAQAEARSFPGVVVHPRPFRYPGSP